MFDILMYLFENYIYSEAEIFVDHNELTDELIRAGFHQEEIIKALNWLEKLAELQENDHKPYLYHYQKTSFRYYVDAEISKLDTDARGFILFLEQVNVLDMETREIVIDRVMALDTVAVSLEDLKWIILMVLFNVPGKEYAYAQMEGLIFDEFDGYLQ